MHVGQGERDWVDWVDGIGSMEKMWRMRGIKDGGSGG